MIGFLDRSFCSQPCVNRKCLRNLTPELMERARKWWGEGEPPITYSDFIDTPVCEQAGGFLFDSSGPNSNHNE